MEGANACTQSKGYLKDKFFRLKARRGHKRAAMAIAHKIIMSAYHMLATGSPYEDMGDAYLDEIDKHHVAVNLVRRLERLGFQVTLEQKAA